MIGARTRLPTRSLIPIVFGIAVASMGLIGVARADAVGDSDSIANTSNVPVVAHLFSCPQVAVPANATPWTPTAFSFDISWIHPANRAYYLADRSHNGIVNAPPASGYGGSGDVMVINIDNVSLTSPNATLPDAGSAEGFYMLPPAGDPMAGIRCDQNTDFGGTNGAGRNELTGPNGAFTVNGAEVWVGDGPSNNWQPGQFNGTATLTNPNPGLGIVSCASAGAICSFGGTAADYASDPCNSSVRVFNLVSREQTDHINVHGCFRTDEGAFDPDDQIALFANPSEQGSLNGVAPAFKPVDHSPFVTLISTHPKAGGPGTTDAHKILKQINFDGTNGTVLADMGIEQAVYSPKTGLFYVAIPGTSANPNGYITVISPRRDRGEGWDNARNNNDDNDDNDGSGIHVVRNIGLTNGCAPNGAALGPDFQLGLFCSSASIQVIDIRSGRLIANIPQTSGGCDEGSYNAGDNHYAGACTDGKSTDNIDVVDAEPAQFDVSIDTKTRGAHSIAADPVTVSFWQPAAAGTGANAGGLCGASPCVLIWKSTGADDPSEFAEKHENH